MSDDGITVNRNVIIANLQAENTVLAGQVATLTDDCARLQEVIAALGDYLEHGGEANFQQMYDAWKAYEAAREAGSEG